MDKYTKIILTVIAVSMFKLAFLGFNPIINSTNKIAICNQDSTECADMLMTGGSGNANLLGIYSNR